MDSAHELWQSYKPIESHPIADNLKLQLWGARQTAHDDLAFAMYNTSGLPSNVVLMRSARNCRLFSEDIFYNWVPCNDYFDARRIIVAESPLSGMVLAARCEAENDSRTFVCAAVVPENLMAVIAALHDQWPHCEYITAPDSPDAYISAGIRVIAPPGSCTWLELHTFGIRGLSE